MVDQEQPSRIERGLEGMMLKLPNIPYRMDKNKNQVISMGNVNYSKMTKDGDIADSSGISGRYYPYITTAKASEAVRVGVVANEKIVAMTVFRGKFVEIDENGKVYYDGAPVGSVATDGMEYSDVQFAAINTKLVIMPFKKYLDCSDESKISVKSLGAKITTTTATKFTSDSVTLEGEAAQSYRMVGGSITGNVFTAESRKVIGTYAAPYYLAVDRNLDSGGKICFTPVRDLGDVGGYEVQKINGKVITLRASLGVWDFLVRSSSRKAYIYDKSTGTGELISIYGTYEGTEMYPDWFEFDFELMEACGLDDRVAQVEIYISCDLTYAIRKLNGTNCRMCLQDKRSKKSYDKLVEFNISDLTRIYVSTSDIGSLRSQLFTATIDNGGWAGDFRDFLSAGRGVTVSTDVNYLNGSVAAVGQNYFTVDENATVSNKDFGNVIVTVTADENMDASLGALFKVGDVVNISGCSISENNIDFKIDSIGENGKTLYAASDIFTATPDVAAVAEEGGEAGLVIERRIPTLDYICESDNRLYGCSNEGNMIYVSALGDPTNIYTYQGISTDSFAVPVASEEPFTGCCPYDGGVLFWKENKLHKLLGSYPAEYALYTYNIDGVQEGSHKSLQNIGEVLYYKGVRGVFAFNGSPQLISSNFGDKYFEDAVAGTDGAHYLISMKSEDGGQHFFSFDTRSGLWVREGDCCVTAFARQGKDVYMLEVLEDGGEIYRYGALESSKDSEWFIQFTPIYETIEGQKSYSRIKLRIELPLGSYMVISVRCDGGMWAECGKIVGRVDGVIPVMVPINRCDKFELKIEGKGPCTIHSILREYYVAADNR